MSPILDFSSGIGKSDPQKSNLKVFLQSENFFYIFQIFKVFLKSYKIVFRLTGYAIMTLTVFLHFPKFEKYRRNSRIAKILANSVSTGPIY